MLFWLFIIILCIGFGLLYIETNYYSLFGFNNEKHPVAHKLHDIDIFAIGGAILILIGILCTAGSLFVIIGNHLTADSYIARSNERYEALCYKVETENAADEFGLRNKEIIDEVQEWNEEIAEYKALQDNFWIGLYYPNIYDQFETIPLE